MCLSVSALLAAFLSKGAGLATPGPASPCNQGGFRGWEMAPALFSMALPSLVLTLCLISLVLLLGCVVMFHFLSWLNHFQHLKWGRAGWVPGGTILEQYQQYLDGLVARLTKSISSGRFGNSSMRPEQSEVCRTLPTCSSTLLPPDWVWWVWGTFFSLCWPFGIIMRCTSCSVCTEKIQIAVLVQRKPLLIAAFP